MITVVIPFFNNHDTIAFAIASAKLSKFVSEVIVVDDGSIEALVYNDPLVKVFRTDNRGVSSARNFGARKAANSYVAFLDSDDEYVPGKLDIQIKYLLKHQLLLIGSLRDTSKSLKFAYTEESRELLSKTLLQLLIQWDPHISTILINKSFFLEIGGFDESLRRGEDCEFYLRVLQVTKKIYILRHGLVLQIDKKLPFGVRGLSADLKEMYRGELLILSRSRVSSVLKIFFRLLFFFRYLRRKLLSSPS